MKKVYFLFSLLFFNFISCTTVFNSKECVVLDKTKSFSSQVTNSDTVYIIEDSYNLGNETVNLPNNIILRFEGGSLIGGNLKFNNTYLANYVDLRCNHYSGQISNKEITLGWFYFPELDTNGNEVITENFKVPGFSKILTVNKAETLEEIIECCASRTLLVDRLYAVDKGINIKKDITLKGYDVNEGIYGNMIQNAKYGFFNCTIGPVNNAPLFDVQAGASVSVYGVCFITDVGRFNSYIWDSQLLNGNKLSHPFLSYGLNIHPGAAIKEIHDSSFVGCTYGIKVSGGSIGIIKNSYFSLNRYGIWIENTNDFTLTGCRFNSNLSQYQFSSKSYKDVNTPTKENDAKDITKLGGGVYFKNVNNSLIKDCRFEFDFIGFILDEAGKNIILEDSIFDAGTISQIFIFNSSDPSNTIKTSYPAIENVVIQNNTMARGVKCRTGSNSSEPGYCFLYIAEGDNRGSEITFKNNCMSDDIEVDTNLEKNYEQANVFIYNTSNNTGKLNLTGNDFLQTKAKYKYKVVDGSSGSYTIDETGTVFGTYEMSNINNVLILTHN